MGDTSGIRIVQTVASGGTAVLYKAVQTSLDRIVAVKRLHAHLTSDENFTRRFILEAKAAASLDHPNIVHVIDFGKEDGHYQIVMEFVEGESLKDVLERWRPVHCDLALAIAHQILLGLEHAHARGIVHRDIKPGNIMLTPNGRVKITDFGLAKLTQAATSHTAENSILGTPLYMSPEQAFGESVDQRSDLFSLGTVLFEMITGRQPFASENYMGVIQNIINRDVPAARSIVAEIPPEIEAITSRALSKDRDHRFQSAREFRAAIEETFGVVRLNDARARLGVLLDTSTDTRVLLRSHTPARKPHGGAGRAAAAIGVLLVLAGGTAIAVFRPDVVDTMRRRAQRAPVQQADIAPVMPDFEVPVAALIRADSGNADAGADNVRDVPAPEAAPRLARSPRQSAAGHAARRDSAPDSEAANAAQTTGAAAARSAGDAAAQPAPSPPAAKTAGKKAHTPRRRTVREGYLRVSAAQTAEVYVDGRYRGDAPPALRIVLPAGSHTLECRYPNYEPYRETLRIVAGELSQRNITLEKLRGSVSLATDDGVQLFVDGVHAGTTPLRAPLRLDAGPHTLALKKPGYHTWTSKVTVDAGETLQLNINLSRRY